MRAMNWRTLKSASSASPGQERGQVLHLMLVARPAPPGAAAPSFQNVGLSGRTAVRTTTFRMRRSSLLHRTRTTHTHVCISHLPTRDLVWRPLTPELLAPE